MSRTVAVLGERLKSMLGMYLISPPGVTVLATHTTRSLQLGLEYYSQKVALLLLAMAAFRLSLW